MTNIRSYIEVTKPRTVLALVFTSFAAMIVASRLNTIHLTIEMWLLALIAITAGCAGCNAVTCYLDRDIDAIMTRTRNRPLPSGRINPPQKALIFGLILITLSLLLPLIRNLLSFIFMALGVFDNVIIYSLISKRRTPINIILGGISGGLPAAFGWVFVTNSISWTMIVMVALVMLWIPNHFWSLAVRCKEDYEKANVPMLPVVVEEKKALRIIVSTSVLLVAFSILPFYLDTFKLIYLATASVLGGAMLLLNLWLFLKPTKRNAWIVYKFSSPYLVIIFSAMIIDVLLL
nr:heme o synthase [Candidatus Freyarchaeota archaeon]